MKFIKLDDIKNEDEALFAYIDEVELRTDFDTGKTKVTVMYFRGKQELGDKITQIHVTLGDNYISDTYHLTGKISDEQRVKAALDAGRKIFEEKEVPANYFSAIFMSQRPILYTKMPDSKAV